MTLAEALQLYAQKLDNAFVATVERNYARLVEDGFSDDEIAAFQAIEAERYPELRDGALAELREWLAHGGKALQ